jgi:hypothetical protein
MQIGVKVGGMTEQAERERNLAAAIARGVPIPQAAALAGYKDTGSGYRAAARPGVKAAIVQEVARLLAVEGAPLALSVLVETCRDQAAPARVRVDAAKTILDRAGIAARQAPEPGAKPLSDMGTGELRALVERLEGELAGRARPVIAPGQETLEAQEPDFLA